MPDRDDEELSWPATSSWGREVKKELKRKGQTQRWLASQVGCSEPSLSDLLNAKTGNSPLVAKVCDVLGLAPPTFKDRREYSNFLLLRALRDQDPDAYGDITERILRDSAKVKLP